MRHAWLRPRRLSPGAMHEPACGRQGGGRASGVAVAARIPEQEAAPRLRPAGLERDLCLERSLCLSACLSGCLFQLLSLPPSFSLRMSFCLSSAAPEAGRPRQADRHPARQAGRQIDRETRGLSRGRSYSSLAASQPRSLAASQPSTSTSTGLGCEIYFIRASTFKVKRGRVKSGAHRCARPFGYTQSLHS